MAKINGLAGKALATILALAAVGVVGATVNNTVKVAVIEGNRFSSEDGLLVWQAIADIRANMAALPQEAPPAWFVQRIDRIDEQITRVHDRLDKIEDGIE